LKEIRRHFIFDFDNIPNHSEGYIILYIIIKPPTARKNS